MADDKQSSLTQRAEEHTKGKKIFDTTSVGDDRLSWFFLPDLIHYCLSC